MRILLVSHGLPPESVGGVEQHVAGLADALLDLGHEVHIYTRTSTNEHEQGTLLAPTRTERGAVVTRAVYRWEGVQDLAGIYGCAPMAASMQRFLSERQRAGETFDVAHVHHMTGLSTGVMQALRDAGLKVALTLHDYWLMCPRGQMWHPREEACAAVSADRCGPCLQRTYPHWIPQNQSGEKALAVHDHARHILALADQLVVPSRRAVPPFVALGVDEARFTVVENGVDTGALSALPEPTADAGPLRLGYLGTVMPSKGLHVLLDAVLQQPSGTVSLDIWGNVVPYHGDNSYGTRCFAKLQPGSAVRYHGPYRTEHLPGILPQLDVVCAPALWHEAYGLTIREALAAGRPVLTSRIGGLQDAITDGTEGHLLPPGDAPAWAAAIRDMAADRDKVRRMAGATRGRARGFAAMAADLEAVYRDLAGKVRNPA